MANPAVPRPKLDSTQPFQKGDGAVRGTDIIGNTNASPDGTTRGVTLAEGRRVFGAKDANLAAQQLVNEGRSRYRDASLASMGQPAARRRRMGRSVGGKR